MRRAIRGVIARLRGRLGRAAHAEAPRQSRSPAGQRHEAPRLGRSPDVLVLRGCTLSPEALERAQVLLDTLEASVLIVLPRGASLEALDDDAMLRAGWQRVGRP